MEGFTGGLWRDRFSASRFSACADLCQFVCIYAGLVLQEQYSDSSIVLAEHGMLSSMAGMSIFPCALLRR
jgi:hypothetical protein